MIMMMQITMLKKKMVTPTIITTSSTLFIKYATGNIDDIDVDNDDGIDDDNYDCSDDGDGSDNTYKTFQIKYVEGDQKLMVTVERCDGLKKESGIFGGYHHLDADVIFVTSSACGNYFNFW